MFAGSCKDNGVKRKLWSPVPGDRGLASPIPPHLACIFVIIYGNNIVPEPGPLSKSFEEVKEEVISSFCIFGVLDYL